MKFKSISKFLTIGILLNSFNLTSFAGILSEDGRYETFEGSHITINNILEEDKVDVEIGGNTLVNAVGTISHVYNNGIIKDNKLSFTYEGKDVRFYFENSTIKENTTYTIFANITKNTLNRLDQDVGGVDRVMKFSLNNYHNNYIVIKKGQTGFLSVTTTTNSENTLPFLETVPNASYELGGEFEIENIMVLEGDWTDKEIPDYFEGMKSIGELNSLEIKTSNKNLFNPVTFNVNTASYNYNNAYIKSYEDGIITVSSKNTLTNNDESYTNPRHCVIKLKPNTSYYFSYKTDGVYSKTNNTDTVEILLAHMHPNLKDYTVISSVEPSGIKFTTDSLGMLGVRFDINDGLTEHTFYDIQIEEDLHGSEYTPYKETKYLINTNEPLRSLPNGVKDRIIKKDGQWFIERKCKEIILVGSEDEKWGIGNGTADVEGNTTLSFQRTFQDIAFGREVGINLICDKFPVYDYATASTISEDKEWIRHYSTTSGNVGIKILKSKLPSEDIAGFKKWLSENPVSVIYELEEPIYEPLNIDLSSNLYLDTTYISTNSTIPANIKVTVDRVLNRAVEAIELAKTTPSVENIAIARMWTNLARESTKKDELQDLINSIIEIKDLEIEKQTVSANLDIYIKSENMLSLSLDTNNVTFDDFSGVEDVEKLNAINLTVNSSLPYKVNAYLASEIQNADKSNTMDKDILNIRVNGESNYNTLIDAVTPLTLLDDQNKGNDIKHGIDLKLKGNIAHQKDVYKATIKFEVEQK